MFIKKKKYDAMWNRRLKGKKEVVKTLTIILWLKIKLSNMDRFYFFLFLQPIEILDLECGSVMWPVSKMKTKMPL